MDHLMQYPILGVHFAQAHDLVCSQPIRSRSLAVDLILSFRIVVVAVVVIAIIISSPMLLIFISVILFLTHCVWH